eukprot:g9469.t1
MPIVYSRNRGPCSWCCKKLRMLKLRMDSAGEDEAVLRLRSRLQEIQPDHVFLLIGRHISEFFRIDSTIGEGGFGTVFKAKPTAEGCKLAPWRKRAKWWGGRQGRQAVAGNQLAWKTVACSGDSVAHVPSADPLSAWRKEGALSRQRVVLAVTSLLVGRRATLGRSSTVWPARRRTSRLRRQFFNLGGEPETPDNVVGLFYDERLAQRCVRLPAREATRDELLLKHRAEHVDQILGLKDLAPEEMLKLSLEFDSIFLCPETTEAALLSAGCVLEATARVCSGEVQSACCVVRPPGHHAEPSQPRGFCLFGNVALGAALAQAKGWASKVLIVDFDVHHGNGTQRMFEDDPSVLFCSIHRYDRGKYYPGGELGNYTSHGTGAGEGYCVNVPWEVASNAKNPPGDAELLYAFDRLFMPIAKAFTPDLVLVSAGFDAAPGDPLGGCRRVQGLAGGKVVLAQEGGYNVDSNSESMAACTRALLGDAAPDSNQMPGFNVVDERDAALRPAAVCHFLRDLSSTGPTEHGMVGLLAAFVQPQEALFQVMELLEGPDLFDFLAPKTEKLPESAVVGLVRQMLEAPVAITVTVVLGTTTSLPRWQAVHYMHRTLGALHRDIKPENFGFIKPPVKEQSFPPLKLFDVGLAWVLEAPVTEETPKDILHIKRCGTACYMAPEVWDGNTGPPSDVWSLGIVSYIVTSLEVPFKLMETKAPKSAVRNNDLSFESNAWTNTSEQAKEFLKGMLQKEYRSRLTTKAGLPTISEGSSGSEGAELTPKCVPLITALPPKSRRSEAGIFESMTAMPEKFFADQSTAER